MWAYVAHPSEVQRLAERDQTYLLSQILAWVDARPSLAAGFSAAWLLLQACGAALGAAYACCPPRPPPPRHPWDRFWRGGGSDEDAAAAREALLPRHGSSSPRATGYFTPPSRGQSPWQSPSHPPASGALASAPPLLVPLPPPPAVAAS